MLLQLYCVHKSLTLIETQVWIGLGGAQGSVSLISLQMTAREGQSKVVPEFLNDDPDIKLSFGKEVTKY